MERAQYWEAFLALMYCKCIISITDTQNIPKGTHCKCTYPAFQLAHAGRIDEELGISHLQGKQKSACIVALWHWRSRCQKESLGLGQPGIDREAY